jgi:hypothetical protein
MPTQRLRLRGRAILHPEMPCGPSIGTVPIPHRQFKMCPPPT